MVMDHARDTRIKAETENLRKEFLLVEPETTRESMEIFDGQIYMGGFEK